MHAFIQLKDNFENKIPLKNLESQVRILSSTSLTMPFKQHQKKTFLLTLNITVSQMQ